MDAVRRSALWVVAVSLALGALSVHYAAGNLGINTDTADMIASDLPWRRDYMAYKQAFPQYVDTIVIVLDGPNPDLVERASTELAARLREEQDLVQSVYRPGAGAFFERHGLLYLSVEELEKLSDNLAQIQPFLGRLAADPSLRGLFELMGEAVEAVLVRGERLELAPVLEDTTRAVDAAAQGRSHPLSWRELILGEAAAPQEQRRFIVVQPNLDYGELLPARPVVERIRALSAELGLGRTGGDASAGPHAVRMRITGSVALEYEELQSVRRGASLAAVLALIMVGAVLCIGLRSLRLVFAALLTLVVGLAWTAAFATLAVGRLNLISIAFAVLYIGLGVAYAVHFCLRYREAMGDGLTHAQALRTTAGDIGGSLVLCAVTTGIGFFAFVPTDFQGVSELGLISGTGMFISLLATLTLLPALLTLMPPRRVAALAAPAGRGVARITRLTRRARRSLLLGAAVLGIAAGSTLPHARFDNNPLELRDPGAESVRTYRELLADSDTTPWSMAVIARDARAAALLEDRLQPLPTVARVLSLADFVPQRQEQKLALIDEMALLLGPVLTPGFAEPSPTPAQQEAALEELRARLSQIAQAVPEHALTPDIRALEDALSRLESALRAAGDGAGEPLRSLESSLLGTLPEQLEALGSALHAERVRVEDLPPELVERWVAPDGRRRVEITPAADLNRETALRGFVAQVREVAPRATGSPLVILESGDAVVGAFQQAFLTAFVLIAGLLVVLMRRLRDVGLVVSPLILAGVLTVATMVLTGMSFNFANVIALPLLLGVGVDNGIHMVNRMRVAPPADGDPLRTSTARAVVVSALTTICSFGNLAFSSHQGMASMGVLLSVGLAYTLICTLVLLPAMLAGKKGTF